MVYDVKSWWLMPYTIPVYISEVSQLNFPWVFLIIMHSNVFPKVPPRQKPAKPHPHCSDLLRFRLLKTPSNLPSLQRKRWSDATAWVYQSWFAFATLIGSDILQELAVQKRRWEEKKRKGRETGRRSWWVHKRRMGPMDGGPIWWIFFSRSFGCYFYNCWPTGKLWRLVSSGCYRNLKLGEFHWLNQHQKPFRGMRIEQAMP